MTETVVLDANALTGRQPAAITQYSTVESPPLQLTQSSVTPKQRSLYVETKVEPKPRATVYATTETRVTSESVERPSATVYHDVTPLSPVREKRPSTSEYGAFVEPKRW